MDFTVGAFIALRLSACALLFGIVGVGVALIERPLTKLFVAAGILLFLTATTHFELTHVCARGHTDSENYQPYFSCDQWTESVHPFANEITTGVGATALLAGAICWVFVFLNKKLKEQASIRWEVDWLMKEHAKSNLISPETGQ
ncbi:MAG: hypothetical protein ABUS56_04105 [Acidobacteriota bacterium]